MYENYSEDGEIYYNGREFAKGSMMTKTTYTSNVKATNRDGEEIGGMDVEMVFSPVFGMHTLTRQIMAPLLKTEKSHGMSYWGERRADLSDLIA